MSDTSLDLSDMTAVQAIAELAQGAAVASVLSVPGEAPGFAWIQDPGKDARRVTLEAHPRNYRAFSLAALCGQIDHFAASEVAGGTDGVGAVVAFIGRGRVSVVLDEGEKRLNRLAMDLPISKPFAFLCQLGASPTYFNQRDIVWKLRTEIGADNIKPEDLLGRLRTIKFSSASDGTSEVRTGRESMGAQVNRTVMSGGTDFPDECTLAVPVYADVTIDENPIVQHIVCAIDIDVEKQTFLLKPMPGELERAQRETDEEIRAHIEATVKATNFNVFNGGV